MPKELTQDTIDELIKQGVLNDDGTPKEPAADPKPDEGDPKPVDDPKPGDPDKDSLQLGGDPDPDPDPDPKHKTLDAAGYSDDDITKRLEADKGLSDEFKEELKGKLDPEVYDLHIGKLESDYQLSQFKKEPSVKEQAEATKKMNDFIYDQVGGKDKFKELGQALSQELSTEDLGKINAKLSSGNEALVKEGLAEAVKEYNNIRGMGGKLMEGDAGNRVDPPAHITKEEYRMIMRTEKYKTDPRYAQKIDADRLKTRQSDSERYGNGAYYGFHPNKGRYAL